MSPEEEENKNDKMWLNSMGEVFEKLRSDSGSTSYAGFAHDNRLDRTHYGRIEQGQNMTAILLRKVVKIHGIKVSEFYDRVEKNYEKKQNKNKI
jgi:hypothetical protein